MGETLASLTVAVMRPLVGATFRVTLPTGRVASGTLTDVDERPSHEVSKRIPFSFTLRVQGDQADAQQGQLRLEHDALGTLDVFAVPVGLDGDAVRWHVVFS